MHNILRHNCACIVFAEAKDGTSQICVHTCIYTDPQIRSGISNFQDLMNAPGT